ncbi:MAG: hypothetical protein ACM3WQ_02755 [Chloroflexota bacterium]|nr:hypothetical protein [Candidatus Sulfotelmatobacter sp.]
MVTRGHRTLGRTIRKLSNSVEFSNKESMARESEKKYKENVRKRLGYTVDYPVQDLRDPSTHQKDSK